MELLTIDQLRPGYIVASAVTNRGGAVLVPLGFKLTDVAIERLRNAGVASVIVDRPPVVTNDVDRRIAALAKRFDGIDDPILLQIRATIEKRLNFIKLESGS